MDVNLGAEERDLLERVLQDRLGDYSMQIADADDSAFKDQLRQERTLLQAVLERLSPAR